jgi:hypothetical protein
VIIDVHTIPSNCPRLASIVACLLLGLAGCGGSGSNDGPPTGGGGPPPGSDPTGTNLTVSVKARDAFGAAVPEATITLYHSSGTSVWETRTRTDANGEAVVRNAPDDVFGISLAAEALFGISYEPSRPGEDQMDFAVTLHPYSALSPGIGRVAVTGVSADARQLRFSARLYVIESHAEEDAWWWGSIDVEPCNSCIEGPGNLTAAYSGASLSNVLIEPDPESDPLAIALLLDQGESVAVNDPEDRRLLAARYLPIRLDAGDAMALAAFAADDARTGQPALLPTQPVTMFPLENPAFTPDGRSYFATIDSLATLEGGQSPLFDAVGEMIGFTASAAPLDSRRAVVVVTGGGAIDCGDAAECRTAQESLLDQGATASVELVAVGRADSGGRFDRVGLGPLSQSHHGIVFWADNPRQIPTILGRVPEVLDGRHAAMDVAIELESPVAGAFASGNTVSGNLQVIVCPWDCSVLVTVPFALRVP